MTVITIELLIKMEIEETKKRR